MPAKPQDEEGMELIAETAVRGDLNLAPKQRCILDVVRERLLALESNIERRYLKPPFSKGYVLQH